MDHGNMHNMSGMAPPRNMSGHGKKMMHMSFYWGNYGYILFTGWPGTSSGMYALALILVFFLAVLIEWLSHSRLLKAGSNNVVAGCVQTAMHAVRMGLAYFVMLAVMSFNGGVLLMVILGHAVGFFAFGSRAVKRNDDDQSVSYEKPSDLPPMSC
ncbi:hypothetical protein ACFE04_013343 [Oxalis oulophora]